ncbi:MAG: DNA-binding domain-containing protein [Roseiarcus sp.]
MPFESTIEAFARALSDPARPAPPQTLGREGRPDARRFAVYRNNVAVGLIGAIEARYPIVRRLVGDEFFRAMARAFVAAEKPRSPLLIHYGDDFADFVARFEPAREIAYLPDVARLESAWVEAYHAAEAPALVLAALGEVDPDDFGALRFFPHPAARLLRFSHPAASIWAAHQGAGEPRPPEVWRAEDALVSRPEADVVARILPPGGYEFARALFAGARLAEAAEKSAGEGFDPGSHFVGLLEAGAIRSIR